MLSSDTGAMLITPVLNHSPFNTFRGYLARSSAPDRPMTARDATKRYWLHLSANHPHIAYERAHALHSALGSHHQSLTGPNNQAMGSGRLDVVLRREPVQSSHMSDSQYQEMLDREYAP